MILRKINGYCYLCGARAFAYGRAGKTLYFTDAFLSKGRLAKLCRLHFELSEAEYEEVEE